MLAFGNGRARSARKACALLHAANCLPLRVLAAGVADDGRGMPAGGDSGLWIPSPKTAGKGADLKAVFLTEAPANNKCFACLTVLI